MPELIINTGPLIALCAAVDDLKILKSCYTSIHVPRAVADEVMAGPHGQNDLNRIVSSGVFEISNEAIFVDSYLRSALDMGEAAVIASALHFDVKNVAIDERIGRRIARLHGLRVTGSTGILLKCAKNGVIHDLEGCFRAMRGKGVWVSDAIIREALSQVGR